MTLVHRLKLKEDLLSVMVKYQKHYIRTYLGKKSDKSQTFLKVKNES